MFGIFYLCSSLTDIDLSNFNINNISEIDGMFYGCELLKNENIIIKDKKIFNRNEIFHNVYIF